MVVFSELSFFRSDVPQCVPFQNCSSFFRDFSFRDCPFTISCFPELIFLRIISFGIVLFRFQNCPFSDCSFPDLAFFRFSLSQTVSFQMLPSQSWPFTIYFDILVLFQTFPFSELSFSEMSVFSLSLFRFVLQFYIFQNYFFSEVLISELSFSRCSFFATHHSVDLFVCFGVPYIANYLLYNLIWVASL